jgi:tetratricopeptide (TPR) repeat protein
MLTRRLTAWAFVVLSLSPAAVTARAGEPKGERYALLVGVHKYSEEKVLRPLPYSEKDVTDLAAVLRENDYKPDNVVVMTQAAAADEPRFMPVKQRILKELRLLLKGRAEEDTVVALAGHGVHFTGDPASYFCPADAQLGDKSTLLSLADIYAELEKCPAGVKVLLVDACRNDPFQDPTRAAKVEDLDSVTRPKVPEPPRGVVAFFSCSEKEKAYEDEDAKHGVFFRCVIDGLKGEAAGEGGDVTVPDLERYVKRQVGDFVRAKYAADQLPEVLNRTRGLVTLVRTGTAEEHLRKGKELLEAKKYDAAAKEFTRALRADPKSVPALLARADAYAGKLDREREYADCSEAIRLDPSAANYHRRAKMWFVFPDKATSAKAIPDFSEAIRLDPKNALYRLDRARFYAAIWTGFPPDGDKELADNLAKADEDYTEVVRLLKPNSAEEYNMRAIAYRGLKQYDKALADHAEAIRKGPKDSRYFLCRADTYSAAGELDKAVADCTEAIRLNPKDPDAYLSRAFVYGERGDKELAAKDRETYDRLSGNK